MAQLPVAVLPALVDGQLVRPRYPIIGGQSGTMRLHGVMMGPHTADSEHDLDARPVNPFSSMQVPWTVVPTVALGHDAPSYCSCAGQ